MFPHPWLVLFVLCKASMRIMQLHVKCDFIVANLAYTLDCLVQTTLLCNMKYSNKWDILVLLLILVIHYICLYNGVSTVVPKSFVFGAELFAFNKAYDIINGQFTNIY